MNAEKFYIEYEEVPEITSWDAVLSRFTAYAPVYKVMERRFLRKDVLRLATKDAKKAADMAAWFKSISK